MMSSLRPWHVSVSIALGFSILLLFFFTIPVVVQHNSFGMDMDLREGIQVTGGGEGAGATTTPVLRQMSSCPLLSSDEMQQQEQLQLRGSSSSGNNNNVIEIPTSSGVAASLRVVVNDEYSFWHLGTRNLSLDGSTNVQDQSSGLEDVLSSNLFDRWATLTAESASFKVPLNELKVATTAFLQLAEHPFEGHQLGYVGRMDRPVTEGGRFEVVAEVLNIYRDQVLSQISSNSNASLWVRELWAPWGAFEFLVWPANCTTTDANPTGADISSHVTQLNGEFFIERAQVYSHPTTNDGCFVSTPESLALYWTLSLLTIIVFSLITTGLLYKMSEHVNAAADVVPMGTASDGDGPSSAWAGSSQGHNGSPSGGVDARMSYSASYGSQQGDDNDLEAEEEESTFILGHSEGNNNRNNRKNTNSPGLIPSRKSISSPRHSATHQQWFTSDDAITRAEIVVGHKSDASADNKLRQMNTIVGFTDVVGSVAVVTYDNFERASISDQFDAERLSGDFLGDLASIAKTLDGSVVNYCSHRLVVAFNALIPKGGHQMGAVRFLETVRQRVKGHKILVALTTGQILISRNVKPPQVIGPAIDRGVSLAHLQELSGQATLMTEDIVFAMPDQGRGKAQPVDYVQLQNEDQPVLLYTSISTTGIRNLEEATRQRNENDAILRKRIFMALRSSQWYKALKFMNDVTDSAQKAQLSTITNHCIGAMGSDRVQLSDGYCRAQLEWKQPQEFFLFGDGSAATTGNDGTRQNTVIARKMRGMRGHLLPRGAPGLGSRQVSQDGFSTSGDNQTSSVLLPSMGSNEREWQPTPGGSTPSATPGNSGSSQSPTPPPALSVGVVQDGYEFLPVKFQDNRGRNWRIAQSKVLGRKGNTKVFLGTSSDGLPAAIRTIDIRNATDDEWQLEINASVTAACVKHRHSAEVHSVTKYNDRFLLAVSEYIPGGRLNHLLNEFGGLMLEPARRFSKELLEVIRYLQRNKVVHGCVMPSSVLMSMDGSVNLKSYHYAVTLTQPQGPMSSAGGGSNSSGANSQGAFSDRDNSGNVMLSSISNMAPGWEMLEVMKRTIAFETDKVGFLAPELIAAMMPPPPPGDSASPAEDHGMEFSESEGPQEDQVAVGILGAGPDMAESGGPPLPRSSTLLPGGGGPPNMLGAGSPHSGGSGPRMIAPPEGGGGTLLDIMETGPVLGSQPTSVSSLNSNMDKTNRRLMGASKDSAKELLAAGERVGHQPNTDIYGYAVTCLAMFVGKLPADIPKSKASLTELLNTAPCVTSMASETQRDELVSTLVKFLLPCLDVRPHRRPTAEQLVHDQFFM